MEKNVVQIENTSFSELVNTLGEMMGGKYVSLADIPNIQLNAKQAAAFLGIAHNTLIRLMEDGVIRNTGTGARITFGLPQLFDVKSDINQHKYKRS